MPASDSSWTARVSALTVRAFSSGVIWRQRSTWSRSADREGSTARVPVLAGSESVRSPTVPLYVMGGGTLRRGPQSIRCKCNVSIRAERVRSPPAHDARKILTTRESMEKRVGFGSCRDSDNQCQLFLPDIQLSWIRRGSESMVRGCCGRSTLRGGQAIQAFDGCLGSRRPGSRAQRLGRCQVGQSVERLLPVRLWLPPSSGPAGSTRSRQM